MQVVILCGGEGTRLREHTESMPKPLVEIGGKPILWHIMKIYSHYGFNDFILCLGYKGYKIREYFLNYDIFRGNNFKLTFTGKGKEITMLDNIDQDSWNITFVETGTESNKGERLKKVEKYIDSDTFFVAYGDDLSDIDIKKSLEYHKKSGNIVTLTAIKPESQFGVFDIDKENKIIKFKEKPRMQEWINGGFFVMNKKVFDYIKEGYDLEKEAFEKLVKEKKIGVFKHEGFWECMNTFKDTQKLNDLWKNGNALWKKWK